MSGNFPNSENMVGAFALPAFGLCSASQIAGLAVGRYFLDAGNPPPVVPPAGWDFGKYALFIGWVGHFNVAWFPPSEVTPGVWDGTGFTCTFQLNNEQGQISPTLKPLLFPDCPDIKTLQVGLNWWALPSGSGRYGLSVNLAKMPGMFEWKQSSAQSGIQTPCNYYYVNTANNDPLNPLIPSPRILKANEFIDYDKFVQDIGIFGAYRMLMVTDGAATGGRFQPYDPLLVPSADYPYPVPYLFMEFDVGNDKIYLFNLWG